MFKIRSRCAREAREARKIRKHIELTHGNSPLEINQKITIRSSPLEITIQVYYMQSLGNGIGKSNENQLSKCTILCTLLGIQISVQR